jgi:hypothetical protein
MTGSRAPWLPRRFEIVTVDDLARRPALLAALIDSYRRVFGARDTWGEGWRCRDAACGAVLPFDDPEPRPRCACGSDVAPYHDPAWLEARLRLDLAPDAELAPVAAVMRGDDASPVGAFMWANVAPMRRQLERFVRARYHGREEPGRREVVELEARLGALGVVAETPVLYGDELGVLSRFRADVRPLLTLLRIWLEHGAACGVLNCCLWTAPQSPAHELMALTGFRDVHTTRDGAVFVNLPDARPLLEVLSASDPSSLARFFRSGGECRSLRGAAGRA